MTQKEAANKLKQLQVNYDHITSNESQQTFQFWYKGEVIASFLHTHNRFSVYHTAKLPKKLQETFDCHKDHKKEYDWDENRCDYCPYNKNKCLSKKYFTTIYSKSY